MLISSNKETNCEDFENLINYTTTTLQEYSKKQNDRYLTLLGNKLEDEVYDVMCTCAKNTPFENTIELISGQKFPDIVANNFFGVEVKSTKQNHWRTTGNSVLESTRVDDIERIYMLFGKIHNPIEFKCRPYQECLYDVLVTHSPRYAIDMDLQEGHTIFDKIGLDYDTIRTKNNPIKPFKDYYRGKLLEGQELWWLDNEEYQPDSIVFRIWNSLTKEEKSEMKIKGFAYFPEIFGGTPTKFDKFTLWLSVKKRIICPNVRDIFTAGGRKDIQIDGYELKSTPKMLYHFIENLDKIVDEWKHIDIDEVNEIWKTSFVSKDLALAYWQDLVVKNISHLYSFGSFDFKGWLENKMITISSYC